MSVFAELAAATHFSFLRGASAPSDMVAQAIALGHAGIGIADRNTVAGVVRAWSALRDAREAAASAGLPTIDFTLATGTRLVFADGSPDVIAYPADRRGWGRLTRLLTIGNLRAAKGNCILNLEDLLATLAGGERRGNVLPIGGGRVARRETESAGRLLLIVMPGSRPEAAAEALARIGAANPGRTWLGATMPRQGADRRRLARLAAVAAQAGVPLLAVNAPLYATPDQRPLADLVTCIREGQTIATAGRLLAANAERHLKPADEMTRLFADAPGAVAETGRLLAMIDFDLGQLRYEYPREPVPAGYTAQSWLERLVADTAMAKWPDGVPAKLQALLDEELPIIARAGYAPYFLTVHDIVRFAQGEGILCQGRGSAANSAVCYVLGITAVDPAHHNLLFSRFISEERREPPDIDVDFEHERREEVMQYVYRRYGRERAGIAATVIHYRPRSAVREIGKALGLTDDVTSRLVGTVWGSFATTMEEERFRESGFDPAVPEIARLRRFVHEIMGFPRHLSQHVGGFVLTEDRLDETVPIHNAAMPDRTFIEWDKDDLDALGLMKVDVLALGMLSCIRRAFVMLETHLGKQCTLENIPDQDDAVFEMLRRGDSIGVFQVESRAQMNMLPRLRPREFYDLVIQVAIVRPGPIQGDMVHPYLRRRQGRERVDFPSPRPPNDPDELRNVLGKTLGVPLFQEQAMKLAIVAADFTPSEANQLRRAMATFRNHGGIDKFETKMIGGMVARGYDEAFAARCFRQIEGFGSYGFPESHAIAFARLVWVSAWLKCHYPAVFAAALLNAQPMGFYAPAQIVRCAAQHGVEVRPIDVNASGWDNRLEGEALALRLGLRQVTGFKADWAAAIEAAQPFASVEDLARRAQLPPRALSLLAEADAFGSLQLPRRDALWEALRTPAGELPLFAYAKARELGEEADAALPAMAASEEVVADYQSFRLSLKAHPMAFLRERFAGEGVLSCAAATALKDGTRVKCAGVVLVRQRPGNGNALFITIEDETGVANIVLWARDFERQRRAVMASRLMQVDAVVQKSPEGVVHLMTRTVTDRGVELARLSDTHAADPQPLRADEVAKSHGSWHPRDVRCESACNVDPVRG